MSDYKKQVGVVRADRILPSEAKRDWLASGDSLSGFAQDVLKICPKALWGDRPNSDLKEGDKFIVGHRRVCLFRAVLWVFDN